jgi:hypothetical protein
LFSGVSGRRVAEAERGELNGRRHNQSMIDPNSAYSLEPNLPDANTIRNARKTPYLLISFPVENDCLCIRSHEKVAIWKLYHEREVISRRVSRFDLYDKAKIISEGPVRDEDKKCTMDILGRVKLVRRVDDG